MKNVLVPLLCFISTLPWVARAEVEAQPEQETHYIGDFTDYLTAPIRWDSDDWTTFGLIAGGLYLTSEVLDENWKDEMVNESHPSYYDTIEKIGNAWGDLRLSGPFMLGVYGYGHWTDNPRYVDASTDMLQSFVYAGAMAQVLKKVFDRTRPNITNEESGWFKGGSSFPSGHTTVAFAVSRSFLNSMDDPSIATKTLFYGLATFTGLARTRDNVHWASDVVAGALLGIYTADYVTELNNKTRGRYKITPVIGYNTIGFQMRW